MKKLLRKKWVRYILYALAVAVIGFFLLNLTFILESVYLSVARLVGLFIPLYPDVIMYWFPLLIYALFFAIICLLSWVVFRSRLDVLLKASYMTVPTAVVLVMVGMIFSNWPWLCFCGGGLLCIGTLFYFHRTKQPWLYYYTVILVGAVLAIFTLIGGEI